MSARFKYSTALLAWLSSAVTAQNLVCGAIIDLSPLVPSSVKTSKIEAYLFILFIFNRLTPLSLPPLNYRLEKLEFVFIYKCISQTR